MSKKQELAPLDKATVSNNINLNINQNDLVELAIAEHMTRIEKHLEDVRERLKNVKEECSEILDKHSKLLAKSFLSKNKEIQHIDKILASVNTSVEKSLKASIIYNDRYSNRDIPKIGEYKQYKDDIEECSSTRSFESSTSYTQDFHHYRIEHLTLSLKVLVGAFTIDLDTKVPISEKDKIRIQTELMEPNTRWYNIVVEKYAVEKEYIKYRFGEKKMKAALVRAALEKSEEGQGILKMLSSVTNVKLLK